MSQLLQNKWLRRGLIATGAALAIMCVFGAGFVAGRWNASPMGGPFPPLGRGLFLLRGHGALGAIQKIDGQIITVQLRDRTPQIILVDSQTRIERASTRTRITLDDLKVGDQVMAIGSPNAQGQIIAKLIGIIDPSNPPPWWNFPPPSYLK